jgi:hypothetical protein
MSKLEVDLARIKEATREMHEAIQDAKAVQRELDVTLAHWRDSVEEMVEEAAKVEIEKLGIATKEAIDEATEKVFNRFDTIMAELLGETRRAKRKHGQSLPSQFREVLANERQATR